MEEMLKAKYGERAQSFHAFSRSGAFPKSPGAQPPRKLHGPVPYGGFITWAQLIKPLLIGS